MKRQDGGRQKGEAELKGDIYDRTFNFSLEALSIYRELQSGGDRAGWRVGNQFFDAATSVGANAQEAKSAESKRDFVHKFQVSQKEGRESLYWLRLMREGKILPQERLARPIKENDEILAIITSIIKTTKSNLKRKRPI